MELNEIQKIKMALLVMNHANVENAQKAYDFVMADSKEPANQEEATQSEMADGIYLIRKTGKPVLFAPGCNKKDCVAVGIKLGGKSIAVSLKDAADGENITLTNSEDETEYDGYINNYTDAVAEWNGKANTKHLEEIGLNEGIKLEDGQYIPAVGEMYLIYLHKKSLNEALEAVGVRAEIEFLAELGRKRPTIKAADDAEGEVASARCRVAAHQQADDQIIGGPAQHDELASAYGQRQPDQGDDDPEKPDKDAAEAPSALNGRHGALPSFSLALDSNTPARPPFHRGGRNRQSIRSAHGKRAARPFGVRPLDPVLA